MNWSQIAKGQKQTNDKGDQKQPTSNNNEKEQRVDAEGKNVWQQQGKKSLVATQPRISQHTDEAGKPRHAGGRNFWHGRQNAGQIKLEEPLPPQNDDGGTGNASKKRPSIDFGEQRREEGKINNVWHRKSNQKAGQPKIAQSPQKKREVPSSGPTASTSAPPPGSPNPANKKKKKISQISTKKRKPTLKTMHIGDLISTNALQGKERKAPKSTQRLSSLPKQSIQGPQPQIGKGVLKVSDFPALSAGNASDFPSLPAGSQKQPSSPVAAGTVRILKQGEPLPNAKKAMKKSHNPSASTKSTKPSRHAHNVPATAKLGLSRDGSGMRPTVFTGMKAKTYTEVMDERLSAPRIDTGDEHKLLRLMKEGNMVFQKKGRQRIKPRKKKFSALKKKVLQERLLKWKESQASKHDNDQPISDGYTACSVCVYGFANQEEMEDDEEYEEIVENLVEMANKIGDTKRTFIPRTMDDIPGERHPSFVEFHNQEHAAAAAACWDGLTVGGEKLKCRALAATEAIELNDSEWHKWCVTADQPSTKDEGDLQMEDVETEVILENALTDDDLEDDECLEESVNDIKVVAKKFGVVHNVRVEKEPHAHLVVVYKGGVSVARTAVKEMGKLVIGGSSVVARLASGSGPEKEAMTDLTSSITIKNVLTDDDLEDKECLEESLNDVRELVQKFGSVESLGLDPDDEKGVVLVQFSNNDNAAAAVAGLDGMVIGGSTITVSLVGRPSPDSESLASVAHVQEQLSGPMFSGDKRIPERFAECKRVPKIPNSGGPRKYATLIDNETVKPLLIEMLGELMRLQRRSIEGKNAKARRRLVMGLREVARGIRSHKVKMVVMANNLDEYGAIDAKLQEILDLANQEEIPVFFEFNKRKLGKAIGKSIKVAVVGVQNADGAHQQFKKLSLLSR